MDIMISPGKLTTDRQAVLELGPNPMQHDKRTFWADATAFGIRTGKRK